MALSPPGSNTSTTTSSPPVQIIQPQSQLIVTKLTEHNYLIRKQQVLYAVRGYGIEEYLTGDITPPRKFVTSLDTSRSVSNPEYATFQRQDELLVSWLLSSLSDNILVTSKTNAIQSLQLSTMKKGNQSMRNFINKVKLCCDALCAAGHKIKEVDQVLHICAGLSTEYDPIVCAITSRGEPLSLSDASALLLSFEARMEGHNPSVFDENNTLLANVAIQGNMKEGSNSGNSSSRARGNNSPRGGLI
ncbi:hypothetical protein DH2020_034412 [Rehmannia glutinosa]|uniref:Uncharacterized protein n=1 Tax=Rehmannia glutinosa TaxID=99300 RepID=A0ABR0VB96_REHGL